MNAKYGVPVSISAECPKCIWIRVATHANRPWTKETNQTICSTCRLFFSSFLCRFKWNAQFAFVLAFCFVRSIFRFSISSLRFGFFHSLLPFFFFLMIFIELLLCIRIFLLVFCSFQLLRFFPLYLFAGRFSFSRYILMMSSHRNSHILMLSLCMPFVYRKRANKLNEKKKKETKKNCTHRHERGMLGLMTTTK